MNDFTLNSCKGKAGSLRSPSVSWVSASRSLRRKDWTRCPRGVLVAHSPIPALCGPLRVWYYLLQLGRMTQPVLPALAKLRQEDCSKFETGIGYIVSCRPAWVAERGLPHCTPSQKCVYTSSTKCWDCWVVLCPVSGRGEGICLQCPTPARLVLQLLMGSPSCLI